MFAKKQLVQSIRVGSKLRSLREAAELSVDTLAARTKLHADSIHAIESGAYHRLPKESVYRKLYIKRYAAGLGLDPAPFLEQYLAEEYTTDTNTTPMASHTVPKRQWLRPQPTLLSLGVSMVVFCTFFGYVGLQMSNLYKPPTLNLTTPDDASINETGVTTIAGITDPEVSVFINGEQVRSGSDGTFATDIDLQPGVNTILVSAKKRHGTESNITKYVMYRETAQVSMTGASPQLTTN